MVVQFWRALLVLLAVACAGGAAYAQQGPQARYAFVVGNDGYDGAELRTAANDASLIADMLRSAGFDVTGARNLDQETLRASYREFVEKVAASGPEAAAFVYISGYGVQSDGENYFIPPGARVARPADLALNAVRLSDFTRALSGLPAQARVMVFDVAYDGPFAREGQRLPPGLAIMDAAPGDVIVFNASPGAVAPAAEPPYGPFAQALAEMAREPGLPLLDVLDRMRVRVAELTRGAQVPYREARLEQPLILFARSADAPAPQVSAAEIETRRARPIREVGDAEAYALALDRDTVRAYEEFLAAYPTSPYARNVRSILAARREAITWRRTVQANTAEAYWSYLDRYPDGPNAPAARARLARLQAALEPPPTFRVIEYDIAPPPREEIVYFAPARPRYFEVVEAPIEVVYVAPRPIWWRPPPPPIYVEEAHYFLPMPVPVAPEPVWLAPPVYVAPPPPPLFVEPPRPGFSVNPYVAVPAALAAGIVAGKIISDRRRDRPAPPPGAGPAPVPFIPAIAPPPRGRQPNLPPALQQNLQPQPGVAPQQRPALPPGATLPPGSAPQPGVAPQQRPALPPGATLPPGSAPQPGVAPQQRPALPPGAVLPPGSAPQPGVAPQQRPALPPGATLPPGSAPQPGVAPQQRPALPPGATAQQQQLQQQRQQQMQQQRQQEQQRQQQLQQQRQQQMQQQQLQQQRQQQLQQQRQQQLQQQQLQQQRQQQMQQQQLQQQRQQQIQQQQLQQQRQQQMQQQQMQMQRQQQMQQQQRPQNANCGRPGQPPCR